MATKQKTSLQNRVLKPRRGQVLKYLAISLLFTALGIWVRPKEPTFMHWFAIGFFGLCSLVLIVQLFTSTGTIYLDSAGLRQIGLFYDYRLRWDDVDWIGLRNVSGISMASFRLKDAAVGLGARISEAISGVHGGWSNAYGLSPSELVALMDSYRKPSGTNVLPRRRRKP